MAIVMPQSALATLSVRNIMNRVGSITIDTNYREIVDAALAWLRSR